MSDEDHIRVRVVQRLIERSYFRSITVRAPGTEKRLVKISQRASCRMRREISPQPLLFAATFIAAADLDAFTVQRYDVPRSKVVAVETLLGVACFFAEVFEIVGGALRVKLVIPWSGPRAVFHTSPGF